VNEKNRERSVSFKWLSVILFITALLAVFQALFMLTVSDYAIISLTKAWAKVERDQGKVSSYFHGNTDDEIDRVVEGRRSSIIQTVRRKSAGHVIAKVVLAGFLLIVGLGILNEKPKPTRVLAMILAIILCLGFIITYGNTAKSLKALKYIDSKIMTYLEIVWFIVAPLSGVACFVAFGALKKVKKEKVDLDNNQASEA